MGFKSTATKTYEHGMNKYYGYNTFKTGDKVIVTYASNQPGKQVKFFVCHVEQKDKLWYLMDYNELQECICVNDHIDELVEIAFEHFQRLQQTLELN